jgi:hypothetical protein
VFPAIDAIVASVTVSSIDKRIERHHIALFPQTAAPHGISPNGTHKQPDMVTWSTTSVPDAIGTCSSYPLHISFYCTAPTARLLRCHGPLHSCLPMASWVYLLHASSTAIVLSTPVCRRCHRQPGGHPCYSGAGWNPHCAL